VEFVACELTECVCVLQDEYDKKREVGVKTLHSQPNRNKQYVVDITAD
jgi:hypothetical protein